MTDSPAEETPLAWTAVLADTPVRDVNGTEIGRTNEVLGAQAQDVFHGIVVEGGALAHAVFVPAQHVTSISDRAILLDLNEDAVKQLAAYEPESSFHLGFVGFLGRKLGWVDEGRQPG